MTRFLSHFPLGCSPPSFHKPNGCAHNLDGRVTLVERLVRRTNMALQKSEEDNRIPRLPLLPHIASPEKSNMPASPIRSLVSIPFSWEEEPGKPKQGKPTPLNDVVSSFYNTETLELPPRLLLERDPRWNTKQPSPTAVLEGPYSFGRSTRFDSPSFRTMIMAMGADCYGSFRSEIYGSGWGDSMEGNKHGIRRQALVLRRNRELKAGRLGFMGLWKREQPNGKRDVSSGSHVYPSSVDGENVRHKGDEENIESKIMDISRIGSLSNLNASKSHFWSRVRRGLKQTLPWKKGKTMAA